MKYYPRTTTGVCELPKVVIMGQVLHLPLDPIPERHHAGFHEPDEYPLSPPVPTPYFTPEFFFDPASPPSTPDPLEIAMCIARRIPVRWTRPAPAPRVTPVKAFPAFVDYTPTVTQAWANMLRMAQGLEGQRRTPMRLGVELSPLQGATLHTHIEHAPCPVESVRSHLSRYSL